MENNQEVYAMPRIGEKAPVFKAGKALKDAVK